jgi:uncharacterized membrane protein
MDATRDRLGSWWFDIRNSLWLLPSVVTAGAVVLALVTVWLDQTERFDRQFAATWLFGGGVEGARGVLTAIAGTMMTVTALVFSIMVVAFQVATSQLTPRVLRSVMVDRGNQLVLGVFVATFTYALVVLRAVRAPLEEDGGFVPSLSVSFAIVLALLSVALLIYFMHHSSHILRASVVIARVADATRELIATHYPEETARTRPYAPVEAGASQRVTARGPGYLQAIGVDTLLGVATDHALTIEVVPQVGEFVLPGADLARVWGSEDPLPPEIDDVIHGAFDLGHERTMQQDVGFGLQQLADIGIRALSPAVNDPTTATVVVDNLAALLVEIANRGVPDETRVGPDGRISLILRSPSFADLVAAAFAQIAHYGAGDPVFRQRLSTTLERMAELVPDEHRHAIEAMRNDVVNANNASRTGNH